MSAIDDLVNAAMAKAAANPPAPQSPAPGGLPAVQGEVLPPTNYQPAALPSLKEVAQGARTPVDFYLQVVKDGSGIKIGKDMQFPVDEIRGTLDMTQLKRVFVVRVDNGNGQQAKYVKSLNMITSTAGVPLDRAIQQVLLPGGKVKDPYVSYLAPVVLTEDVADPKKGSTFVAAKGKTVMVETSYSASMDFEGFVAKLDRPRAARSDHPGGRQEQEDPQRRQHRIRLGRVRCRHGCAFGCGRHGVIRRPRRTPGASPPAPGVFFEEIP